MPKKRGPKRSKEQREFDLQTVVELYVKGLPQYKIAAEIGVSQQQISHDLKEIHKRWRDNTTLSLDDYKQKELQKLDRIETEYWNAWEESKAAQKKMMQRTGGPQEIKEMRQEDSAGDPRYLEGVLKCSDRRSKLLGLDAPVKTEVTGDIAITDFITALADIPKDPEEDA